MAEINFDEVEQFAALFADGEVPRFPQSPSDLPENLTQREKIRAAMPELWQRLHGGNEAMLPADVLLRMHKQQLRKGDEIHLKKAGLDAAALTLESAIREGEIRASFQRMQAEREAREAANEQLMASREADRLASMQMAQAQQKAVYGGGL